MITRLLAELSTSWSELVGVDFQLRHTEMNPQFAQIAPPNELSVLLSFQVRIHESTGVMALCMPYRSIEKVAPSLTAHSYFSGQRTNAEPLSLRAGLDEVDVEVRAEIGAVDLRIEDVLGAAGRRRRSASACRPRTARGCTPGPPRPTRCSPGSFRRQLAVQVQERVARPLAIESAEEPVAIVLEEEAA